MIVLHLKSDLENHIKLSDILDNCYENEYSCTADQKCISKTWLCDGESDCVGGDDEAGCGLQAGRDIYRDNVWRVINRDIWRGISREISERGISGCREGHLQ